MITPAPRQEGPFTWDDFIRLDEDDGRELIDGELVEVEVPAKWMHEYVVASLCAFLRAWTTRHGGIVLASSYKVRISNKRGVMPDVQLFRAENLVLVGQDDGLARGRPDLAVEVLSPSSRRCDRVTKLAWYASIGIPEYWVVDTEAVTLERLVLDGGSYVIAQAVGEGETFAPSSFEGLEAPLVELFPPRTLSP
jgi:Uma2 family endonuclease